MTDVDVPEVPEEEPLLDDRFVLRPDGQVWIYLEGRDEPIRCRRPKLKDDTAMWEAYLEIADALSDWATSNQAWIVELNGRVAAEGRPETDEEKAEGRKRRNEFQFESQRRYVGWWALLVGRMADVNDLFTGDAAADAPLWMAEAAGAARVINHWRSMPVPSSPR